MSYDMRNYLKPRRLTIATWDIGYMVRRNDHDPFKDWDKAMDGLKERGFNTIRIDAFPGVIVPKDLDMEFTWPDVDQPLVPWMWINKYTSRPGRDLIEFIQMAKLKGLYLILTSWWYESRFIPANTMEAAQLWINLLEMIKKEAGLENILFVDFVNEIPGFLPGYKQQLEAAKSDGNIPDEMGRKSALEFSPPPSWCSWNRNQLTFMKSSLDSSLAATQEAFPELRFTYSMNIDPSFEEIGLSNLDVLDIHFFMIDQRYDVRARFNDYISTAYVTSENYRDFCRRSIKTIDCVGPMLRQRQRQQLKWAKEFSEKIGAPLLTTEGWACWFYNDHPDMDWEWQLDWSEAAVDDAIEFGLWGITTNTFAEPHFQLWKDIKWHRRINEKFLNS